MILYLDIGNTRLKWRLEYGNECLASGGESVLQLGSIADDIDASVVGAASESLDGSALSIKKILVSSVAGDRVNADVGVVFCERFHVTPHFVVVEKNYAGVIAAYSDTSTLGVDRWLTLLAAHNQFKTSCLIIDAGSAITIDLIDAGGVHQGGMIAPGVRVLSDSLQSNTSNVVFNVSDVLSASANPGGLNLGQSTPGCVAAGIQGMFSGLVSSVSMAFASRYEQVLVAGGDAELILEVLNTMFAESGGGFPGNEGREPNPDISLASKTILHYPDLVMDGLRCWYQYSFGKS